ncbi:MAG: hypothetical protein ACLUFN_11490, partial [Eubacterium sp.]
MNVVIPAFNELTFREDKHLYHLNGQTIPSVTTLMNPLSNSLYGDVDRNILCMAANRGTEVHNAIENFVKYNITDIEPQYDGYFNAFISWWKSYEPNVLGTECKVYHKFLRYAGTADMLIELEGQKILVDFKTSASINKMLTGVQLEAYAKAFESHRIAFDSKAILHLQKNGKYHWLLYDKNDTESWEVFGALLTIYN